MSFEIFYRGYEIFHEIRSKHLCLNKILFLCLALYLILSLCPFKCATAGQGHKNCLMCHKAHTAKDLALFPEKIKPNIQNPHTGKDMEKIDALCMMCHAAPPYGKGIRQIDTARKHPFGIKPGRVKLPEKAKGFGNNSDHLSCMGCHDPHPSNTNLSYLRTPEDIKVSKLEDIFLSCLWCHPNMEIWLNVPPIIKQKTSKPEMGPKPFMPHPVLGGTDSGL